MLSFGQRLKAIRKDAQLTQAELAEKLMVSVQAISKWECDNTMPDISQIVPLSAILGVTTDCLLGVGGDERADRDTTRLIDAKQTLIILYLYHNEFADAEEVAAGLPQRGSIRASMEIEIYSKKNDHDKCLELSNQICDEAVHHYLRALAVKARRISLLGNARKQDAIATWRNLLDGAKFNDKLFNDTNIRTKWWYSGLNNLANDYIAISEIDKAFEVIEELTDTLILHYHEYKEKGHEAIAAEVKSNFRFYLHSCYNWCFQTDDNIISNHPKFKKCEQMLDNID